MPLHAARIVTVVALLVAGGLAACRPTEITEETSPRPAIVAVHRIESVRLASVDGVDVLQGGFGSAMAPDPAASGEFLLLTDRGPNVDGRRGEEKVFAVPSYVPQVLRVQIHPKTMTRMGQVEFHRPDGQTPISGLPNPEDSGGNGETARDVADEVLAFDPYGLDSEGLAVMLDGSFWISDEYGPHLVHFDEGGREIERINPFGAPRSLPRVLARRRPNRGMEGLTRIPGLNVLVGVMQSPLDNPRRAGRRSRVSRIVWFDLETAESRQYVYVIEDTSSVNSEIVALSDTTFLVLERDNYVPNDPATPARRKAVYRVNIAGATDVSDPRDRRRGMRWEGETLEEIGADKLSDFGVVPVTKHLVVDLLALGYLHDKPEGMAIVDDSTLAVINDDDFSITSADGVIVPKRNPNVAGGVDYTTITLIRLARPLNRTAER